MASRSAAALVAEVLQATCAAEALLPSWARCATTARAASAQLRARADASFAWYGATVRVPGVGQARAWCADRSALSSGVYVRGKRSAPHSGAAEKAAQRDARDAPGGAPRVRKSSRKRCGTDAQADAVPKSPRGRSPDTARSHSNAAAAAAARKPARRRRLLLQIDGETPMPVLAPPPATKGGSKKAKKSQKPKKKPRADTAAGGTVHGSAPPAASLDRAAHATASQDDAGTARDTRPLRDVLQRMWPAIRRGDWVAAAKQHWWTPRQVAWLEAAICWLVPGPLAPPILPPADALSDRELRVLGGMLPLLPAASAAQSISLDSPPVGCVQAIVAAGRLSKKSNAAGLALATSAVNVLDQHVSRAASHASAPPAPLLLQSLVLTASVLQAHKSLQPLSDRVAKATHRALRACAAEHSVGLHTLAALATSVPHLSSATHSAYVDLLLAVLQRARTQLLLEQSGYRRSTPLTKWDWFDHWHDVQKLPPLWAAAAALLCPAPPVAPSQHRHIIMGYSALPLRSAPVRAPQCNAPVFSRSRVPARLWPLFGAAPPLGTVRVALRTALLPALQLSGSITSPHAFKPAAVAALSPRAWLAIEQCYDLLALLRFELCNAPFELAVLDVILQALRVPGASTAEAQPPPRRTGAAVAASAVMEEARKQSGGDVEPLLCASGPSTGFCGHKGLPAPLGTLVRQEFTLQRLGTVSTTQQVWRRSVQTLGYRPGEEVAIQGLPMSVDMAVLARDASGAAQRVVIEVDGPQHFEGPDRRTRTVATMLRDTALLLSGYHVIVVPFWTHDKLSGSGGGVSVHAERARWLAARFDERGLTTPHDAAAAPPQ